MRRALVVDDEELLRVLMRETLDGAGWQVEVAADASEAQRLVRAAAFEVALIDLNLVGQSGLDLCRVLLSSCKEAPPAIVFVSDLEGVARGHGFLPKPFRPSELLEAVDRALGG